MGRSLTIDVLQHVEEDEVTRVLDSAPQSDGPSAAARQGLPQDIVWLLQAREATTLLQSGDLDEATSLLEALPASIDGVDLTALWLGLGRAWERSGTDVAPARTEHAYRQAALLAPARGLPLLAAFLQRSGRLDEAIVAWRELVAATPTAPTPTVKLAQAYQRAGRHQEALDAYLALVTSAATQTNVLLTAERVNDIGAHLPAPSGSVRVALLGNATLDHLEAYVKVEAYKSGLRPTLYHCPFDQYAQDILDPQSALYAFGPQVVACAIHASKIFPTLHDYPFDLTVEERRAEIDRGFEILEKLLETLASRVSGLVLIHNFAVPHRPTLGILDQQNELGQTEAFAEINMRLARLVRARWKNVFVVDEDRVQARTGKATATDARLWLSARSPWSGETLGGLAREYLRYIRASKGLSRKCVVVDLDNTLWGGVVGEDGLGGLQLGSEAPGNAFVALQQELERLWRRGILLAICSKNNPDEATAVLAQHPEMVLRPSHFAAQRINWTSKVDNIREIARELNIGLDSLVFLDDSPVERALVRGALPEVLVPELPSDPAQYRSILSDLGVFDTLAWTDEDRLRNERYQQQKARRELEVGFVDGEAGNVHDYLATLDIVVDIEEVNTVTLPRVAQLTVKTNQFNLTTRRYTESQISEHLAAGWRAYSARVHDRFGDNGLTGVLLVQPVASKAWQIETLLLSCRVMGRGVEIALLAHVADVAAASGIETLQGWYVPTPKNAPARDCYERAGWTVVEQTAEGTLWRLDVRQQRMHMPTWLRVTTPAS